MDLLTVLVSNNATSSRTSIGRNADTVLDNEESENLFRSEMMTYFVNETDDGRTSALELGMTHSVV